MTAYLPSGLPAKYIVRGFASSKHPRYPVVKTGDLLLETVHADAVSKDIEVAAWRARMKRGEVAYIEVISLGPPLGTETFYS